MQLASAGISEAEVSTVDSYQGRDKGCIIMSFVHNNTDGRVSYFSHVQLFSLIVNRYITLYTSC